MGFGQRGRRREEGSVGGGLAVTGIVLMQHGGNGGVQGVMLLVLDMKAMIGLFVAAYA